MTQPQRDGGRSLSLELRAGCVGVVTFDVPGRRLNVIEASFAEELDALLSRVAADDRIVGLVLASGKVEGFCAGAEVETILSLETREDARRMVERAHTLFARLRDFAKPVVAAVHGAALGGGFELALACRARVASSSDKTRFGLPEVKLGLIPAFHGLQELAHHAGLSTALRCGLGATLSASEALARGLVTNVVAADDLLESSTALALHLAREAGPHRTRSRKGGWLADRLMFAVARRESRARTHGNHPAAERVIDVLECFARSGEHASYRLERDAFAELAVSSASRQLLELFLETRRHRESVREHVSVPEHGRVLVLGTTALGATVASLTAGAGLEVELCAEPSRAALAGVGIVVETAGGGVEGRAALLQGVEREAQPGTIFATTSPILRVASVAAGAAHPENVVGMFHAGSLLEVVRSDATSSAAVRRAVSLGWAQGRTVVVTGDGVGRFSSRLRLAFVNEAFFCLADGVRVEVIARATLGWGFAEDPFSMLDAGGARRAAAEAIELARAIGARCEIATPLAAVAERGLGRGAFGKTMERLRSTQDVHDSVAERLGVPAARTAQRAITAEEVQMRCALAVVNEAYHALGEGILGSTRDGNIAAILGAGFPSFRGGPFRYAEALGSRELLERLRVFRRRLGARFEPAPSLIAPREDAYAARS